VEREREVSEEQLILSIFGEQELCFRGAYISSRDVTSDCTPDLRVVEISQDEFKPACTAVHLNIVMRGTVS